MKCLEGEEGKHQFSWRLVLVLRKWLQLKESPKGRGGIRIKSILQVYAGFFTSTL